MDIKKTIINLFATHPNVDTFYMTTDGQFFAVKANADYQSQRLAKKGVSTVTRAMAVALTAEANAAAIAHPEQTTALTPEQLAEQAQQDADAQKALDASLQIPAPAPAPAAVDVVTPDPSEGSGIVNDAAAASTDAAPVSTTKTKAAANAATNTAQ